VSKAEVLFHEASSLDTGDETSRARAADLYRQALVADPCLVAALINLGNLHYADGRLPEALALYERDESRAGFLRRALQPGQRPARRGTPRRATGGVRLRSPRTRPTPTRTSIWR
jgi:hypothetical protein